MTGQPPSSDHLPRTRTALLAIESLESFETEPAFDVLGILIDFAGDTADANLIDRASGFAASLAGRELNALQLAELDYFQSNCWAVLQSIRRGDREAAWSWDQPELRAQILLLRRAQRSIAFSSMPAMRQCEILTNLGNAMSTLGRFVDAQAYWTAALNVDPHFWMARANRGHALLSFGAALYDEGHTAILALHGHRQLLAALVATESHPHLGDVRLVATFAEQAAAIGRAYNLDAIEQHLSELQFDFGKSPEEAAYRQWCIKRRLFLNPLNEVTEDALAAADVLTVPGFVTKIDEPPIAVGIFNQLKQEFVSARYAFYQGSHAIDLHFADHDVLILNTLDYTSHSLATEQIKSAFRMAYSILDKIAYFLNRYLRLGIASNQVYFRDVWYVKKGGPARPVFEESENWPFRGLYWLSRDLFDGDVQEVIEPDAHALANLRNHWSTSTSR